MFLFSLHVIYSPLDMNVRSKFKLSHAASNFVKYSFLWSPCANFNADRSGMVRVASTSLFLYKSNVTPAAFVRNKMESHTVSTIKMYDENCIIAAIMCLDARTFLSIIWPWSSSSSSVVCVVVDSLIFSFDLTGATNKCVRFVSLTTFWTLFSLYLSLG